MKMCEAFSQCGHDTFLFARKGEIAEKDPLKIFEYMAHSKAIVASNLDIFREILEHGIKVLLVGPDDVEQ